MQWVSSNVAGFLILGLDSADKRTEASSHHRQRTNEQSFGHRWLRDRLCSRLASAGGAHHEDTVMVMEVLRRIRALDQAPPPPFGANRLRLPQRVEPWPRVRDALAGTCRLSSRAFSNIFFGRGLPWNTIKRVSQGAYLPVAYAEAAALAGHQVRRIEVAKLDFPMLRKQLSSRPANYRRVWCKLATICGGRSTGYF